MEFGKRYERRKGEELIATKWRVCGCDTFRCVKSLTRQKQSHTLILSGGTFLSFTYFLLSFSSPSLPASLFSNTIFFLLIISLTLWIIFVSLVSFFVRPCHHVITKKIIMEKSTSEISSQREKCEEIYKKKRRKISSEVPQNLDFLSLLSVA